MNELNLSLPHYPASPLPHAPSETEQRALRCPTCLRSRQLKTDKPGSAKGEVRFRPLRLSKRESMRRGKRKLDKRHVEFL